MMQDYEQRKMIQIVLYILNRTGGLDYYHLFKILYFAEQKHLAKWGARISADQFHALPHGPVPSSLYQAIETSPSPRTVLARMLAKAVQPAQADAPNVLLPLQEADLDYLSTSEREALDQAIEENANLTFSQLRSKSHDSAWSEAFYRQDGTKILSPVSMAKALNADDATIAYIQEQTALDDALA